MCHKWSCQSARTCETDWALNNIRVGTHVNKFSRALSNILTYGFRKCHRKSWCTLEQQLMRWCVRCHVRVHVVVCLCMSVYEELWRVCECVGARLEMAVAKIGRNLCGGHRQIRGKFGVWLGRVHVRDVLQCISSFLGHRNSWFQILGDLFVAILSRFMT